MFQVGGWARSYKYNLYLYYNLIGSWILDRAIPTFLQFKVGAPALKLQATHTKSALHYQRVRKMEKEAQWGTINQVYHIGWGHARGDDQSQQYSNQMLLRQDHEHRSDAVQGREISGRIQVGSQVGSSDCVID